MYLFVAICGVVVDAVNRPDSLLVKMHSALNQVDVLITSGGVSMGEKVSYFDYLCHGGYVFASFCLSVCLSVSAR